MSGYMPRRRPLILTNPTNNADCAADCAFETSSCYSDYTGGMPRRRPPFSNSTNIVDSAADCAFENSSCYSDYTGTAVPQYQSIVQRLRDLLNNKKFTDVKFSLSCGIKPKPVVYAHKAILAVGSPLFATMLFSEPSCSGMTEIQINSIPEAAFKSMVEYLYTDDVYFENDSSAIDILDAAKKFEICSLVDCCESYFVSKEITVDSACSLLFMASDHKMEDLKTRCLQFIQENTGSVIRSDGFSKSPSSVVQMICSLPKLNLNSEKELLDAVLNWTQNNLGKRSGIGGRRILVEPFLKLIRFCNFSCKEFVQIAEQYSDVFHTKEAMAIVMYLSNPAKQNAENQMPSWWSHGPNRCHQTYHPNNIDPVSVNEKKISIGLKPVKHKKLSSLVSSIELKCLEKKRFCLKGLVLSFGMPVTTESSLSVHINLVCFHNNFNFTQYVKVQNATDVKVYFHRPVLTSMGNVVNIKATAEGIENYNFLQFDDDCQSGQFPFELSIASIPQTKKLFFISDIIYAVLPWKPKPRESLPRDGKTRWCKK